MALGRELASARHRLRSRTTLEARRIAIRPMAAVLATGQGVGLFIEVSD
jgi:hypothetical protein